MAIQENPVTIYGASSGVVSVSGVVSGTMSISGSVSGVMSVSGAVSGVMSVSGFVGVNQGAASSVAWPVFTSQTVSSVITGFVSISNSVGVTGPLTDTQLRASAVPISGMVSVSGSIAANQGAASSIAWPVFTSQTVSSVITGFVSVSNTVTVTGLVSVSNTVTVTGNVSVSGLAGVSGTISVSGTVFSSPSANSAASGSSMFRSAVLSNTVLNVKTASGLVYGYHFYNPNSSIAAFVQLFPVTAASVTLGTTVPRMSIPIPSGQVQSYMFTVPNYFISGVAAAATISSSGTTANALPLIVHIDYI